MSVKCTKGFWNVNFETGEICAGLNTIPFAKVFPPNKQEGDIEEYISNAVVMTEAAEMYYLLLFIKGTLETLYMRYPEQKGKIWEYVEGRIAMLEQKIEQTIARKLEFKGEL